MGDRKNKNTHTRSHSRILFSSWFIVHFDRIDQMFVRLLILPCFFKLMRGFIHFHKSFSLLLPVLLLLYYCCCCCFLFYSIWNNFSGSRSVILCIATYGQYANEIVMFLCLKFNFNCWIRKLLKGYLLYRFHHIDHIIIRGKNAFVQQLIDEYGHWNCRETNH